MASYAVTGASKTDSGDVVSICGPQLNAISVTTAMQMIQLGHDFFVPLTDGSRAKIEIVRGANGPYLRTNWDGTQANNLDSLQPC
ncbi:DUF3892 domain-containing protein [Microbacterium sp. NPDC089696]|uniref:DUF3892 domain-containing protein n=1 Tax=Microbacterium sp. NPDC089696 TaxID=3364199 RepID=UPI00381371A9